MAELFLSYSSKDADRVGVAFSALKRHGFSVFWSQDIPPASQNWNKTISQELSIARLALVFWTENSIESGPVRQEFDQATEDNKLMQIMLDELKPMQLPMHSSYSAQRTMLTNWTGDVADPEWKKLVSEIENRLMPAWARRRENYFQALVEQERERADRLETRLMIAKQTLRDDQETDRSIRLAFEQLKANYTSTVKRISELESSNIRALEQIDVEKILREEALEKLTTTTAIKDKEMLQLKALLEESRDIKAVKFNDLWGKHQVTRISEGRTVAGPIVSMSQLTIDGAVSGDIACFLLFIGPKGVVKGRASAFFVVSHGTVLGDIDSIGCHLMASSRTEGDIVHQSLWVEQGAFFEGKARRRDALHGELSRDRAFDTMYDKMLALDPVPRNIGKK